MVSNDDITGAGAVVAAELGRLPLSREVMKGWRDRRQ